MKKIVTKLFYFTLHPIEFIQKISYKIKKYRKIKHYKKRADHFNALTYLDTLEEDVFKKWFSASTDPDRQLAEFIIEHDFQRTTPAFKDISMQLFRCDNPYKNFTQSTNNQPLEYAAHIGTETLSKLEVALGGKPKLAIEVGSFIGSSAQVLGRWLQQSKGTLICVDTWCGDINMWLRSEFAKTMDNTDGNPKIFDHFMQNMINSDLTSTVIPFRTSSIVAAKTLRVLNWNIDLVYLDSAHEYGETFLELSLFYDLLEPGGVLFGDDYSGFPAVKHDVDLFCKIKNIDLVFTGERDTWFIKKP